MFSQSLSVDAVESMADTQPNLFENSTSETSQPKSTDTLRESEKIADTTTADDLQNTSAEAIESELQPVDLHKCDTISASADDSVGEVQYEEAQSETVETANDTITDTSFLSKSHGETQRKY